MKILHVVEAWQGGIASYVHALSDAQVIDGHQVTILADTTAIRKDNRDLIATVRHYDSSRSPFKILQTAQKIRKQIEILKPDIIHCHSTFPGVYSRIRKFPTESKIIYTPHGWSFLKKDASYITRTLYKLTERFLAKNTNKIICISLEELKTAKQAGIPENKLSLVYTGIIDKTPLQYEKKEELNIGFFGRFDYQKGFDIINKAAKGLTGKIALHYFGDFVRNRDTAIPKSVIQHGWIDSQEMHKHMSAMDAIIIPSRWEGFALTPLEAMRASRAIIISKNSSLPEVVIHGYNGLILNDDNPETIITTIENLTKEKCLELGNNGREVFRNTFTFDYFYENMMKNYSTRD